MPVPHCPMHAISRAGPCPRFSPPSQPAAAPSQRPPSLLLICRLSGDSGGVSLRHLMRTLTGALEQVQGAVNKDISWAVRNACALATDMLSHALVRRPGRCEHGSMDGSVFSLGLSLVLFATLRYARSPDPATHELSIQPHFASLPALEGFMRWKKRPSVARQRVEKRVLLPLAPSKRERYQKRLYCPKMQWQRWARGRRGCTQQCPVLCGLWRRSREGSPFCRALTMPF